KAPGSDVELSVFREGRVVSLRARLAQRAAAARVAGGPGYEAEELPGGDQLGLVVNPLTPELQTEMAIPTERKGVVVRDVVRLPSGLEQLAHGDLILEVNRRPTPDLEAYRRVLDRLHAREP